MRRSNREQTRKKHRDRRADALEAAPSGMVDKKAHTLQRYARRRFHSGWIFTAGAISQRALDDFTTRALDEALTVLRSDGPSSVSSDEGATPRIAATRARAQRNPTVCASVRHGADPSKIVTLQRRPF